MDRERLTELLQDPSQVAKQDLTALRTMAERFPWFSGAHLLLAVGEHETGDVLANDHQNSPAAFLPSRAVLFDLVRQEEQQRVSTLRVVKDELQQATVVPPKEPVLNNVTEIAPPEAHENALPEEEAKSAMPELPEAAMPEEGSTVAVPYQKDPAPTPSVSPVAGKAQMPPDTHAAGILELQIKEAILATGYDLGRYEAPPVAAAPPPENSLQRPRPFRRYWMSPWKWLTPNEMDRSGRHLLPLLPHSGPTHASASPIGWSGLTQKSTVLRLWHRNNRRSPPCHQQRHPCRRWPPIHRISTHRRSWSSSSSVPLPYLQRQKLNFSTPNRPRSEASRMTGW